jgi:hypothetical protein
MTSHPPALLFGLLAVAIALAAGGPRAFAQADADQDGDVLRIAADRVAEAVRARRWEAHLAQISRWKLTHFGANVAPVDDLAAKLAAQLAELEQECGLTDVQRKKLELAGRGDIKRFLDRLDNASRDWEAGEVPHNVALELAALDELLSTGIFGEGSLFDKILSTTLSNEPQRSLYQQSIARRNLIRYRDAVRASVRSLAPVLRLSNRQCGELSELILAETVPPLRFGQSDYAMVCYQLSKVPQEKVKAVVAETQWKDLSQHISAWADSKRFLNREGFDFARDWARARGRPVPRWVPLPAGQPPAPERR